MSLEGVAVCEFLYLHKERKLQGFTLPFCKSVLPELREKWGHTGRNDVDTGQLEDANTFRLTYQVSAAHSVNSV